MGEEVTITMCGTCMKTVCIGTMIKIIKFWNPHKGTCEICGQELTVVNCVVKRP